MSLQGTIIPGRLRSEALSQSSVPWELMHIFEIKRHTFGVTDFISSFFIVTIWTVNQKCDVHRFEFSWWWNNFLAFTIVIYFQIVQVCQGCDLNWPLFDLGLTFSTNLDLRIYCQDLDGFENRIINAQLCTRRTEIHSRICSILKDH